MREISTKDKLIAKFKQKQLITDASFEDVKKVLSYIGYELMSTNGSHNVFKHNNTLLKDLTIPTVSGKSVKKFYIKEIRDRINIWEDL